MVKKIINDDLGKIQSLERLMGPNREIYTKFLESFKISIGETIFDCINKLLNPAGLFIYNIPFS